MTRIAARAALLPLALALILPQFALAGVDSAPTIQQRKSADRTMKAYQKQQKRQAKKTKKQEEKEQKSFHKLHKASH